jgi:uncharacterized membrane protein
LRFFEPLSGIGVSLIVHNAGRLSIPILSKLGWNKALKTSPSPNQHLTTLAVKRKVQQTKFAALLNTVILKPIFCGFEF